MNILILQNLFNMKHALTKEPTPSPTPGELFLGSSPKKRLNQWLATGICGNDISSSCLYVSAIAAVFAGVLAPVVLMLARSGQHVYPGGSVIRWKGTSGVRI